MQFDVSTLLSGIAKSVAVATVIGGGTMVLTAHTDNAKQEIRIESLEHNIKKIDTLSSQLDETNKNVARLNGYLEAQNNDRRNSARR